MDNTGNVMNAHFNEGVGVSVGVHGGQVGAAHHSYHQAALPAVVVQGHLDTAPLLAALSVLALQTPGSPALCIR